MAKPIYKTPPVWQAKQGGYKLGISERFFISVKVYVQGATIEYPDAAIKISFYGANSGCFTRIRDANELRDLANHLLESAEELEKILPAVKETEIKVKSALAAYQTAVQVQSPTIEED